MMIRHAGYEIWYEPTCTVFHKESQTTGQNSPLRTYYITRNRLLFAQRNQQDMTKYITYLYLIGIVTIRDLLKYSFQQRWDLVRATIRGVFGFIKL
jgi:GT2 family glycosyltransferase